MRTSRIYYVLIAVAFVAMASPVCSHGAGWTAEAWSFINTWTGTNVVYSNEMYFVEVTQVITQHGTSNYIPDLNIYLNWTGIMVGARGTWEFPGNSETNEHSYESEKYKYNFHPFDYRITNDRPSQVFETVHTNLPVYGVVTTRVERWETGIVEYVRMDLDTLRDYEMYMAMWERARAIGTWGSVSNALNLGWNHKKSEPTSGHNLYHAKTWIRDNLSNFVITSNASANTTNNFDFTGYYQEAVEMPILFVPDRTNYLYRTASPPSYNVSNLLTMCGMPTNYFHSAMLEKPHKHYIPTDYVFGRVVTSTITIIRYPPTRWVELTGCWWEVTGPGTSNVVCGYKTNFVYSYEPNEVITNDVFLYNGEMGAITGTNGQSVSMVSTQTYGPWFAISGVLSNYTEQDYGYKSIQKVLTNLVLIANSAAWDTNATADVYTWQSHSPCGASVQYPVSSGITLFNEDSYTEWGSREDEYIGGLYYSKGMGWGDVYYCSDGMGGFWSFHSFGSIHNFATENKIMHESQTNIPGDLFVGYDADFYIAQKYPDYWTNEIHWVYSTSNRLAWTTNACAPYSTNTGCGAYSTNGAFSAFDSVYRITAYNGLVGSLSMFGAGHETNMTADISSTELTLVSDNGINAKSYIEATQEDSDTYSERQWTLDDDIPQGTKSYLSAYNFDGRKTEFNLNLEWSPIVIRNYAVTNGFKYY